MWNTDEGHSPRTRLLQRKWARLGKSALLILVATAAVYAATTKSPAPPPKAAEVKATKENWSAAVDSNATKMFAEGKSIFRYDTFGDEVFWSDTLKLHQALEGTKFGGVGDGVSPKTALAVGLKVDSEALPAAVVDGIKKGKVNLDDPATTLTLIKLNAVVGVKGTFNADGSLRSVGLTCAVCHSTVDDSFAPGIGRRLDGWPNRDLNSGAIIALSPGLPAISKLLGVDDATTRKVLASWGPGKFDAELNIDGKAFRPDGKAAATLIPPAYGMAGVNQHTWTGGWGTVTYWNAYVANLELGGQGTFFDRRLMNAEQYPVAARNGFGNKRSAVDMVTSKLGALHFYQLALPTPRPPEGSFDKKMAVRGEMLFTGKAQCSTCHVPPLYTEPGNNTHLPAEIGIDDFQANRSPERTYRTAPLRGLWAHQKGGFYHDGRFATLRDVVDHYDRFKGLALTEDEKKALVEYLKSL